MIFHTITLADYIQTLTKIYHRSFHYATKLDLNVSISAIYVLDLSRTARYCRAWPRNRSIAPLVKIDKHRPSGTSSFINIWRLFRRHERSPMVTPQTPLIALVRHPINPSGAAQHRLPPPWRVLAGFDQLLAATSDPLEFMSNLAVMLRTVPGIDGAWIGRPNDDALLMPEAVCAPAMPVLREPHRMIRLRQGAHPLTPAGRAWLHGRTELSSDIQHDRSLQPWRADWELHGLRSCACVPLTGLDGPHRLLILYSSDPDFFHTAWPRDQLCEFGAIIGTAIENRLRHHALRRSKRLLDTLLIGSETLLEADNADAALRTICQRLSETGLFTAAAIGTVDQQGRFGYRIAAGADAAGVRRLRQAIDDESDQQLLGVQAWKSGTLHTANGYASLLKLRKWRSIATRGGWQSAAAVPIRRGGAIHAILFVVSSDTAVIDPETQRLIEQIARTIGRTLDDLDVKSALRAEREAQSQIARHDALTLLPNRRAFEEALPAAIAEMRRTGSAIGIGMLDLDGFKPINDRFGHAAGDHVLRCLATRLRRTLRERDFIARLGGDEFALIIHDLPNVRALEQLCDRLHAALVAPIELETGETITMAASFGITLYPEDPSEADTLVRHADIALYTAKYAKATRNQFWTLYSGLNNPNADTLRHSALIAAQQLEFHYQPVIAMHNGAAVAIEALARLRDGQTLLSPAAFLNTLTITDRLNLFEAALTHGLACLRRLDAAGHVLDLSINLDAEVLGNTPITTILTASLAESGVAPRRIIIEILESHEFADLPSARHHLNALRAVGVKIALDDLGVEFTTLRRVQRLPVDFVKIDKSFLAEILTEPNDLLLLANFLTMSTMLSLQVCVEGVETPDMLDALRIMGVPLAQGFGIARPMAEPALLAWLGQPRPRPIKGPPQTWLGAFALHTRWLRVLAFAPREASLRPYLRRCGPLSIQDFLAANALATTELRHHYATLMACIDRPDPDIAQLHTLADKIRRQIAATIIASKA
jgi:diguanylate cyclase (GGDEF)-like protein